MANKSDNFTRADSSTGLGNSSGDGTAWVFSTASGTSWGISSNQAYDVYDNGGDYNASLEASSADVTVEVTLSVNTAQTGGATGVCARKSDDSNYFIWRAQFGQYTLYRYQAAGFSSLGAFSATPANGDVIKLSCVGSALNAYLNGTLVVGPVTDTFNQTATKHGLYAGATSALGPRWDDFSITDLSSPSVHPWWLGAVQQVIGAQ